MRHRGGADFAFLEFLFEEPEGDVAPDVTVKVNENRVGARNFVKELGHVVMRLDLNGVRVEGKSQALLNDALTVRFPVVVGVGDEVRVEVADGAVHFGVELHGADRFNDASEAHGNVGHFLADRCGRRGLTVCAA